MQGFIKSVFLSLARLVASLYRKPVLGRFRVRPRRNAPAGLV
jgi:hypothetical protein